MSSDSFAQTTLAAGQVWWEFGSQPAWARQIVRVADGRVTWRRLHEEYERTCNAGVFRGWIKAQGAHTKEAADAD